MPVLIGPTAPLCKVEVLVTASGLTQTIVVGVTVTPPLKSNSPVILAAWAPRGSPARLANVNAANRNLRICTALVIVSAGNNRAGKRSGGKTLGIMSTARDKPFIIWHLEALSNTASKRPHLEAALAGAGFVKHSDEPASLALGEIAFRARNRRTTHMAQDVNNPDVVPAESPFSLSQLKLMRRPLMARLSGCCADRLPRARFSAYERDARSARMPSSTWARNQLTASSMVTASVVTEASRI